MANQTDIITTYQPNGFPQPTQRTWTDIGGGSVAENIYIAGGSLSFAASIGGWTPTGSYTTLAVTNASGNVALPSGSEIVVWNVGSVAAYVNLGGNAVSATTAQIPVQPGSWIALAPGSNGYIAGITASGTTTLTIGAGSGLVTGGGTTTLTGPLPTGSNVIGGVTVADGSDVTQGAKGDAAYAGSGSASVVATLKGLYAACVAATPAGTNIIGSILGRTSRIMVTPTVTASSAYTAGYDVGGLMTFANVFGSADSGILQSIRVKCKSVQTTGLKLYLFTTNPTNSTWTDKAAPAINAADIAGLTGPFALSSPDSGLGTETTWELDGIGAAYVSDNTNLYGVLVCTGTPTFTSTSDVSVSLVTLQD